MKTAKYQKAATIYVLCPHCGSDETQGSYSDSHDIGEMDGMVYCLACGEKSKPPSAPFQERTIRPISAKTSEKGI